MLQKPLASELKIVAIVGDQVVTNYDVEERLKIIALTSGSFFNQKNMRVIIGQIRESLITEKVQEIEAKKYNLAATDRKILESFKRVANDNNMSTARFKKFLNDKNVSEIEFKNQIAASLNWKNLIIYKVRPSVNILDFEMNEYMKHLDGNSINYEYLARTVEFPITESTDAKELKALTERIYNKVDKKNLSFETIVKDFSKSNLENDQPVWKLAKDFPEELKPVIEKLDVKELSKPIKTERAYYLVKLNDKRAIVSGKDQEKIKDDLYRKLFLQKLETKAASYMKQLQRSTYIERM